MTAPNETTGLSLGYLRERATEEQRDHARSSVLYKRGDMALVWVSESDLGMLLMRGVQLNEEAA